MFQENNLIVIILFNFNQLVLESSDSAEEEKGAMEVVSDGRERLL